MRMEHSENFKAVLEEKTREAESIIAAYHGDDSHPFPDP